MKKISLVCLCLGLIISASGCSGLGAVIDRLSPSAASEESDSDTVKSRIYMDEITGILMDFDGSILTLKADGEQLYTFPVSQATLECEDGMISGDEISVIYEGQLSDTDTSGVKVLKVVDEYHKKVRLEDRSAYGKVTSLTPNTISIQTKTKRTATYPITGTEQYYQKGVSVGTWVYIHFKGKFPPASEETPKALDASHLKVLSVSDVEPLKIPAPTPTPTPSPEEENPDKEKRLRAELLNVSDKLLQVLPEGSDEPLTIDMSAIPCYFKGGLAPGSYANVFYRGEFDGATLQGITITAVTGENPEKLKTRNITSTVTGTVTGNTANTVTLLTDDNASVTCYTEGAQITAEGGLAAGSRICVTFDPTASKTSNIYHSIKIADA